MKNQTLEIKTALQILKPVNEVKAWLEYGINLRKGAFDFMSDKILKT
jgi:hypothetical protein